MHSKDFVVNLMAVDYHTQNVILPCMSASCLTTPHWNWLFCFAALFPLPMSRLLPAQQLRAHQVALPAMQVQVMDCDRIVFMLSLQFPIAGDNMLQDPIPLCACAPM